jgi:hypothetical protein
VSLTLTLVLTAATAGAMVLFGWLGARPLELTRTSPRMAPWRFLMVLSAAALLILIVHLVNLAGFTTGR